MPPTPAPSSDASAGRDRSGPNRPARRGLTLGKFAPLHHGHQHVIETALAEVDELSVIIYESAEVTSVPLAVRSAWLRELYPQVRVVEAWDGPAETGYTPNIMAAQERYVIDILGIREITHFYSSEPYGEHMSRALGAIDRRVDADRKAFPTSGTEIRANPFAHRRFLHPRVYRDLVTHVVFLGAPSTGKTTLARTLAKTYDSVWMPEYGREYWEAHQLRRRLTPDQLVDIACGHLARENAKLEEANRYLFTDTNALTTATFAREYHGTVAPQLATLADATAARYDLTFVCDTDIPYDDTPDRDGPAHRLAFQRQVLGDLAARRIPYVLLQGSLARRIATVRSVLDHFRPYDNPAGAFAHVFAKPAT